MSENKKWKLPDQFDDAIVGVARRIGEQFIVYDEERVLKVLQDNDGMDPDEAREWLETNMVAAFLGKGMPAYMEEATADSLPPMDEEDDDG